jgi:hypothetical protein
LLREGRWSSRFASAGTFFLDFFWGVIVSFCSAETRWALMLGVTQKIRMIPLTRERVLSTFTHKVRALRDCDSPNRLHKFQKSESVYTCPRAPFYREMKGLLHS